ncbi:hypothetical protein Tco_1295606, partial [Tanacetum coccineum]
NTSGPAPQRKETCMIQYALSSKEEISSYKMAEGNIPAPTRTDEQLVPVKQRLPIGKSNLLMDLQKMQKKPIFQISGKLLQQDTKIDEEVEKKKKAPKAGKSTQSAPAKQPKLAKKKTSKPTPLKKIRKGKSLESLQAPIGRVVVRETNPGFIRKLPEVEGKGKGIVSDEQAAQSLLDLQKPKKQSIKDQYIFQRRTLVTQDASTGPSAQP